MMDLLFKVAAGAADNSVKYSGLRDHFGALHAEVDFSILAPYLRQAEAEFLEPKLGRVFLDEYRQYIADDVDLSADEEKSRILYLLREAGAYYGIYQAAPFLSASITALGVQEISSEDGTSAPAAQWRNKKLLFELVKKGDQALGRLISYLLDLEAAGSAVVDNWVGSLAFELRGSRLFRRGEDLAGVVVELSGDEVTFSKMTQYLDAGEREVLLPEVGTAFLLQLEAWAWSDWASLSDIQKEILTAARRVVGSWAVARGLLVLQAYKSGRGFAVAGSMSWADGQRGAFDKDHLALVDHFQDEAARRSSQAMADLLRGLYVTWTDEADLADFNNWEGKRSSAVIGPRLVAPASGGPGGVGLFK